MIYRPEVVDQQVENTQDNDEHYRTEFRLESHNDHHTRYKAKDADNHPPEAPFPGENEADEEENQQHATSELEVHLPILLIDLR